MSNNFSKSIHDLIKNMLYVPPQEGEICSAIIREELQKDKPSMIARFGSTEIKAILYPKAPKIIRPLIKSRVFTNMETLSGFFPANEKTISQFSDMMYEDMKLLDILGCWRIEELFLQKQFLSSERIQLSALEPYLQKDPWSEVLEGKKVLVIHPFNNTIEDQYHNNRQLLFNDKRILPEFSSLETIKAVQTIAGNDSKFKDWFEALDFMKAEIDKKDFDVAIIGCGAYGFPLAAHVKRIGKKAFHLGGATQILFGIKGKRWVETEKFNTIINEHFVLPSDEDKVKDATKVEDGCYW
ncbi:MAG: hypothetical protein J7574_08325 [Flavobacterium sp.]|uniref:hypothetical protein n=1 Tax=Flavobacterium sp. TaxID=239 RepID=UPI001B0F3D62|nr:hypothetical protein [Flavobacterium sp.]MBO9584150.1 hypothetical protein [Flavobacterium sp.]